MIERVKRAAALLGEGKPVFIYDGDEREGEVDMIYYAALITPEKVTNLRTIAGGLICYAMPARIGALIGLRYMDDILREAGYGEIAGHPLSYGDPPNFSLWVNHRSVKTGIRDGDRAVTIRALDEVVRTAIEVGGEQARARFLKEFVAPGHVPILLGRGLEKRRGHTELSLALAELGGLRPSVVMAEMLYGSEAMPPAMAKEVAERFGSVLVSGEEIIEAVEELSH